MNLVGHHGRINFKVHAVTIHLVKIQFTYIEPFYFYPVRDILVFSA